MITKFADLVLRPRTGENMKKPEENFPQDVGEGVTPMTQFADLALTAAQIVIPIDPIPLARPRVVKGHAFLPARSRDYRNEVQTVIEQTLGSFPPMTGAIRCRLNFYRKFAPTSRRYGDVDNHAKAVLDACNGLLLADDSAVVDLHASKHQDKNFPRTEVALECID